jgi:hypothetical protein
MQTEPALDLRTIPAPDLKILVEICASKKTNRFLEDNFVILSRILLADHESSEMAEYSEQDLSEAVAVFAETLERNQSLPADHPTRKFLEFNLTAAHSEIDRRKRQNIMKVIK